MMDSGDAATAFQKEMKTRKTSLDLIYKKCQDSIKEMKDHLLNAQNTAVHGFVVVSPLHDKSLEERLENMKTAAVSGIALAKRIQTDTRRAIATLKKNDAGYQK
jgi:SRSO17 transposase